MKMLKDTVKRIRDDVKKKICEINKRYILL